MLARMTTAVLVAFTVTTGCAEPQTPEDSCNTAADCPPSDNPCLAPSCDLGACKTVPVEVGTLIPKQVIGDCFRLECDGIGSSVALVDDSDVPVDGTTCTMDTCSNGKPLNVPLGLGAKCSDNGGAVCNADGACVGCNNSNDCPGEDATCSYRLCKDAICSTGYAPTTTAIESQTAGDCTRITCDGSGGTMFVVDNMDLFDDGNDCTADVCANGAPENNAKPKDSPCSQNGGSVCDGNGNCVECNTGMQCASGVCVAGKCSPASCNDGIINGTESDVDCGGSSCPLCTTGDGCNAATDCSGGVCLSNSCAPPVVVATTPSDGAMNVVVNSDISIEFSGAMIPASLSAQTVPGPCTGSIQVSTDNFMTCLGFSSASPTMSVNDTIATLTPVPGLSYGSKYFIRVTAAARGIDGNFMSAQYTSATGFVTESPVGSSCNGTVVISQIYGGGGVSGATYENDFVELHNRGTSSVSLSGWSVQYAGATGTTWLVTNLNGSIAPGGYYLVEGAGTTAGAPLPPADATGMTNMGTEDGKVALVKSTTALTKACPTSTNIVDFVGYGSANCSEGTRATAPTNKTTSMQRLDAGCVDTNNNKADFSVSAVTPRNKMTAAYVCGCSSVSTMNESGLPAEIDLCSVQTLGPITVAALATTPAIVGRVLETGTTEAAGANAALMVQVGYGPANVNPTTQSGWMFFPTTYSMQVGTADEYQGTFVAPMTSGSYRYAVRASLDGMAWTYCDVNGAGSSAGATFEITQLPVLTVTP